MSEPQPLELEEFRRLLRDVEAASALAFSHLRSLGHDPDCAALLAAVVVCKVARASEQPIAIVVKHVTSMAEAVDLAEQITRRCGLL
jgi:hypothetical protein